MGNGWRVGGSLEVLFPRELQTAVYLEIPNSPSPAPHQLLPILLFLIPDGSPSPPLCLLGPSISDPPTPSPSPPSLFLDAQSRI